MCGLEGEASILSYLTYLVMDRRTVQWVDRERQKMMVG